MKTIKISETKKEEAMKTIKTVKTNFRKTVIRSATAVVSLFLFASTVNATDLQKKQSAEIKSGETAMSELGSIKQANSEERAFYLAVDLLEKAIDPVVETETWMTDRSYFGNFFELTDESEGRLGLEAWMTNNRLFEVPVTHEHRFAIEAWMVSTDFWSL